MYCLSFVPPHINALQVIKLLNFSLIFQRVIGCKAKRNMFNTNKSCMKYWIDLGNYVVMKIEETVRKWSLISKLQITHQSNQMSIKFRHEKGQTKSDVVSWVVWMSSTSAAAQIVFHHAVKEAWFTHLAGLKISWPFRYLLEYWPLHCPTNIINKISSSLLNGIGPAQGMKRLGHCKAIRAIPGVFVIDQNAL